LCLAIGVYAQPFLDAVGPDVRVVTRIADGARTRADVVRNLSAPAASPQTAAVAAPGEPPQ
jgi:hypothetical protein